VVSGVFMQSYNLLFNKKHCLQAVILQRTISCVKDIDADENSVHVLASGTDDHNEEKDDPLNEFRAPTNETCLQSIIPDYPVTVQENDEQSLGNYSTLGFEHKWPQSVSYSEEG